MRNIFIKNLDFGTGRYIKDDKVCEVDESFTDEDFVTWEDGVQIVENDITKMEKYIQSITKWAK